MGQVKTPQVNDIIAGSFNTYTLFSDGKVHVFFCYAGQFDVNVVRFVVVVYADFGGYNCCGFFLFFSLFGFINRFLFRH